MSEATVSEVIVRGIVVGVFAENAWVIGNRRTGEAIAIDPGDQPEEILAMARDMGVTIKIIANSHAHIDHILGVRGVQSATGAKFLLHQGDLPIARNAAGTAAGFLGRPVDPPPDPDAYPADGDEIDVDGVKLKVIHTPGHTPGSLCFHILDAGHLLTGDTLFPGGPGNTSKDPKAFDQIMASLDRLFEPPDDTRVSPGHGLDTTLGRERPYLTVWRERGW